MTLKYMEGFESMDLGLGASEIYFPTHSGESAVGVDPNHIAVVDGKYYFGGKEISVEEGDKLLDEAIKNGAPYTIFQTIPR